jgi:hypothetical protein
MTLFEVEELSRYWIEHPPLHLTVVAYLGLGKGSGRRTGSKPVADDPLMNGTLASGAESRIGAIAAELGSRIAAGDVHAGFAPVVLDFAELKRSRGPIE